MLYNTVEEWSSEKKITYPPQQLISKSLLTIIFYNLIVLAYEWDQYLLYIPTSSCFLEIVLSSLWGLWTV